MRPTRRRTPRFALIAAGVGVVASTAFAGAAMAKTTPRTQPAEPKYELDEEIPF